MLPKSVSEAIASLDPCDHPWWVAGGWAIDLHLGRVTREHKDLEIVIARSDQHRLRSSLSDWTFQFVENSGAGLLIDWAQDRWLELPDHEIHARGPKSERVEFLLNEIDGDTWRFRRNRAVTMPASQIGRHTADGIPYLAPEIVLLYKAKEPRGVDQRDFENTIFALDSDSKAWLRVAIEIQEPKHKWLSRLA